MNVGNEQQLLHNVVELLLVHKDEVIDGMREYISKYLERKSLFKPPFSIAFEDQLKSIVLTELRIFAIHKLQITAEQALTIIDNELFSSYPDLDFYIKEETYLGDE